ncbi:MAG TPA: RNA polymerase sigma factor [Mycobacteriales bacterium]|nr:RNA polymerase sigma factor [Mycobacteriales bacterium]
MEDLGRWLAGSYARAFRTACLILRNPADAEEAVQEAFLRVWRFRSSIPDGPARDRWLYRVLVNTCLSQIRADAARRRAESSGARPEPAASSGDGPVSRAEAHALNHAVLTALGELPERLRIPVVLRYFTGLDERETAAAIGRRPGTVKSRLHEARARLSGDRRLAAWADETFGTAGLEDAR